jgi:hypothetical protein
MTTLQHDFEAGTYSTRASLGIYTMDDFGTLYLLKTVNQLWFSLYAAMDFNDIWKTK